jgi:hypothetical protein
MPHVAQGASDRATCRFSHDAGLDPRQFIAPVGTEHAFPWSMAIHDPEREPHEIHPVARAVRAEGTGGD